MRILNVLVITTLIVSGATIASAQTRVGEIHGGFVKNETVLLPAAGTTKIDPTKVVFLSIAPCRVEYGASSDGTSIVMRVMGIVARDVELSDDAVALQLLQMGIAFGQEQCPRGGEFYDDGVLKRDQYDSYGKLRPRRIPISLYFGDPTTFTSADTKNFLDARDRATRSGKWMAPGYNQLLDEVYGFWFDGRPEQIHYTNYPKALKLSLAYDAQKARERNEVVEKKRQAEQKAAAHWSAFLKANRVKQVVTIDQLTANPFVYQGQVVAIGGTFERMNSPTQGIFSARGYRFVVSHISTARFTRTGSTVVLAGRVLGNVEIRPGPMVVPHLSFVAIYVAR